MQMSSETKMTYFEVKDFPTEEEARDYGFSRKEFETFKQMFLGKCVPPRPISITDQELKEKGYRSWPHSNLVMSLGNFS